MHCNNLANIPMSEVEFPYETDLDINAEELTLVFYEYIHAYVFFSPLFSLYISRSYLFYIT